MMKISTTLSVILAVQLVLAAGISWSRFQAGNDLQPRPLLDFEISAVDRIEIDARSNEAILEKRGDNWVLPAMHDLPASRTRVSDLLATLSDLQTSWPVASTQSSSERLEVSEDNYQRRLRLMAGNQVLGEYYFGTSPGLRQTHGRRAGEDEVYSLGINNFDMPGDGNDWLDKTLLSMDSVTRISGADFSLIKGNEDETWRLDQVDRGEQTLDPDKVADMESALARLRVMRVADTLPEGEPVTITVGYQERDWTYNFYHNDDTYYLRRDDMDTAFTISKTSYDSIAGITREALLMQMPETGEQTGEEKEEAEV